MPYPNITTSFSTLVDGQDRYRASHVNAVQTAITSIITAMAHKQQLVVVAKARGDYATLALAVAAITDASAIKPYSILLSPGIYETSEVTLPDYVSLVGLDRNSCILQATTAGTRYVLRTGTNSALAKMTISNECDAQSGIAYTIDTNGKAGVIIDNCQITNIPTNPSATSYAFYQNGTAIVYNTSFTVTITGGTTGIHVVGGATLILRGCDITVTGSGPFASLALALAPTSNSYVYDSILRVYQDYCILLSNGINNAVFENCLIEGLDNNAYCAFLQGDGAKFFGCTMRAHGTAADCIGVSGSPTASIAHCRMNLASPLHANLTNLIATPYNVSDTDV